MNHTSQIPRQLQPPPTVRATFDIKGKITPGSANRDLLYVPWGAVASEGHAWPGRVYGHAVSTLGYFSWNGDTGRHFFPRQNIDRVRPPRRRALRGPAQRRSRPLRKPAFDLDGCAPTVVHSSRPHACGLTRVPKVPTRRASPSKTRRPFHLMCFLVQTYTRALPPPRLGGLEGFLSFHEGKG